MKIVYGLLLALLGFIGIVFNRVAVEETRRIIPTWWWGPSVRFGRIVVVFSGLFFVLFGVLSAMGYLQ